MAKPNNTLEQKAQWKAQKNVKGSRFVRVIKPSNYEDYFNSAQCNHQFDANGYRIK
jgi:hypothetical protein